ncbi:hypothetical protein NQ314_003892 [Rhamnusium bicolor]|uniref:Uncharacterized protein n=1 Tax=Rhamnusium bicolor TaxID=1586634 RepID=A0AAV8ZLR5_9CUCU|nr:hypothetical protein NQ314_003892 [Rhamnusium bicolor]
MDHCEKKNRKRNPRETANIFSILTFAYTGGLFKKANKKELEEEDLYEVLKCCSSQRCGDKMEKQWMLECKKGTPSIIRLIWSLIGYRYLFLGVINLTWTIVNR